MHATPLRSNIGASAFPGDSLENSRTLLVVDDEEGPRQSLRMVFKDRYNLLIADDGFQALELARNNHIDAAILDIRMAGMSGIELLGQLKCFDSAIEVIMLTGHETAETARQALRLGACDYLNKPFEISTVRTSVATAMERRALTEQIEENNKKLRHLQEELESQRIQEYIVRTKGEIYASVIHDINNPLTVISCITEIVNASIGDSPSLEGQPLERVRNHVRQITAQITKCIQISQRYLSFLRGRSTEKSSVGVNAILSDLESLLHAHPDTKRHHLTFTPLLEEVDAEVNGTDLIQMLMNLALNACQSSRSSHSVSIDAEFLSVPPDLALYPDGPRDRFINAQGFNNRAPLVKICVTDTGPGVPSAVVPNIFVPYFTTKPRGEGTGLGLAIVERLVSESDAGLHFHTQPGTGTTFSLFLPARPAKGV